MNLVLHGDGRTAKETDRFRRSFFLSSSWTDVQTFFKLKKGKSGDLNKVFISGVISPKIENDSLYLLSVT